MKGWVLFKLHPCFLPSNHFPLVLAGKTTTMNNNNQLKNKRSMSDTDDEFHSPGHFPIQQHDETAPSSNAMIVHQNQTMSLPPAVSYSQAVAREEEKEKEGGAAVRRNVGRDVMLSRAALGFRVLELILNLIAFSVMASDKTQGWSGDSFDRYKEYRYVVAVNAIAFAYAAFQAIDMTYHLFYGKHIISSTLRPLFDFLFDQILAYLLISASSSAASRVDDWVSNWGKDDFTEMATASIGMSFLGFIAFAISSIISGYNLCNQKFV